MSNSDDSDEKDPKKKVDKAYESTCIDCGSRFYLTKKDHDFYLAQGYALPKRCWNDRQRRKKANLNKDLN